jgi:hypothetical protein
MQSQQLDFVIAADSRELLQPLGVDGRLMTMQSTAPPSTIAVNVAKSPSTEYPATRT